MGEPRRRAHSLASADEVEAHWRGTAQGKDAVRLLPLPEVQRERTVRECTENVPRWRSIDFDVAALEHGAADGIAGGVGVRAGTALPTLVAGICGVDRQWG